MPRWLDRLKGLAGLREVSAKQRPLKAPSHKKAPPKVPEASLQERVIEACADRHAQDLTARLDDWHRFVFSEAARSGSVEMVGKVIERYGTSLELNQYLLEESAMFNRVEVFKFILQQPERPSVEYGRVHLAALSGGRELWEVIEKERPHKRNRDFGEIGDALGLAIMHNNMSLVGYLLERGDDPNKARWLLWSAFLNATKSSFSRTKPETIDMLVQHGATEAKAWAEWRGWRGSQDRLIIY